MKAVFKIWRGDAKGGEFHEYTTDVAEGMVVLDAVHDIQARRRLILRADGIARQESAARVQPK